MKIIRVTTVPSSLRYLLKGQLEFIASSGFEVIAVASPGVDLDYLSKKEVIRVQPIEMSRSFSFFSDLRALSALLVLFIRERPDIVHSHTPKAGILSMLAAWLTRVPVRIHTVAGLPLVEKRGLFKLVLKSIEKLTSFLSTNLLINSHGLRQFMIDNNLTTIEKSRVLLNGSSNGLDTCYFDPRVVDISEVDSVRRKYFLSNQSFVFLYVGRIVNDKGIRELLYSFEMICDFFSSRQISQPKLLLVGNFETDLNPLDDFYLNKIRNNNNVIHTGFVEDVRPFYLLSNVLVFPSYREGFPNVVLQSLAMNLPVIVSDINGCNELVVHGLNGYICKPKDIQDLFEAMLNLCVNKDELVDLAENSRKSVLGKYDRKVYWNYLLDFYLSCQK